ncbi:hypothetical protein HPB48_009076 [Haemaphysalis longicornis]|uniref:THAP-type domain-containing protein n=1 Tax=Haemaphysalis longicornis TaxID=44386 RepID=A0A9J6FW83_HAELO|nr:hypothetical protein HPB48_009076 [Haemaphysalis longicornis]
MKKNPRNLQTHPTSPKRGMHFARMVEQPDDVALDDFLYADSDAVSTEEMSDVALVETVMFPHAKKDAKASTFAAPDDDKMLRTWQRAIPRADKQFDRSPVLCKLHFEGHFIVHQYTHSEDVKIERGQPRLTDDAVPSFFPNTPAYLSRKLPQKRQSRTSREEVLVKRTKRTTAKLHLKMSVRRTKAPGPRRGSQQLHPGKTRSHSRGEASPVN